MAGVLLDFRGREWFKARTGRSPQHFDRFWSTSSVADAFYRGRVAPNAFAEGAVHELSIPISADEFLSEFRGWLRGPFPGALELVRALGSQALTACLSNTNALDVARFRDELELHEVFERCFFSNEIGLRKPERACFDHVVQKLGCAANEVLFFDDSLECVLGAKAAGLEAYHVQGISGLRGRLAALGFDE